jgi:hypothetical protein
MFLPIQRIGAKRPSLYTTASIVGVVEDDDLEDAAPAAPSLPSGILQTSVIGPVSMTFRISNGGRALQ